MAAAHVPNNFNRRFLTGYEIPQFGQVNASLETCVPHSLQLPIAIGSARPTMPSHINSTEVQTCATTILVDC